MVEYFDYMENLFKQTAATRSQAEGKHLESILDLTAKAWRRPLSEAEKQDLRGFYRTLRMGKWPQSRRGDTGHAGQRPDVSVLLLPICQSARRGCARRRWAITSWPAGYRILYGQACLTRNCLATPPRGDLHNQEVLLGQARRMLKDERIVNLATEFGGNWLDFRQFETFNGVDRERFSTFDNDLRRSDVSGANPFPHQRDEK